MVNTQYCRSEMLRVSYLLSTGIQINTSNKFYFFWNEIPSIYFKFSASTSKISEVNSYEICVNRKRTKIWQTFLLGQVSHSLFNVVELHNTQETSSQAAKP